MAQRPNRRWTARQVITRLTAAAPLPPWRPSQDAVAEIVLTLLSQNTSDTNSGRAFQQLLRRFPTWDAVIDAPAAEVEAAIRTGGLAQRKAPRLQAVLGTLRSQGEAAKTDGGWEEAVGEGLRTLPLADAKAWLTSLPGIGPKTAAVVLLFALGRPALPVDTHVQRVSQRLGLIDEKMDAQRAHAALEAQMAPEDYYAYHVAVIRHGRSVCKAQRPRCGICVLAARCPSADPARPGG